MKNLPLLAMMLSLAFAMTGCQSPKPGSPARSGATQSTRNNSYSLLHQLLDDEKNVSLLRFIKREESDVKKLVNKIAATAAAGSALLEQLARHDPSITLDDFRLPPGEIATREAIAVTKKKELLGETGDTFELSLLLTQAQALNYGWHLAEVASANESQADRARAVAGIGADLEKLYHEVIALLFSRTK